MLLIVNIVTLIMFLITLQQLEIYAADVTQV
jgi:hypothetical protein